MGEILSIRKPLDITVGAGNEPEVPLQIESPVQAWRTRQQAPFEVPRAVQGTATMSPGATAR